MESIESKKFKTLEPNKINNMGAILGGKQWSQTLQPDNSKDWIEWKLTNGKTSDYGCDIYAEDKETIIGRLKDCK